MTGKERYEYRVKNHLCTCCGNKMDNLEKKTCKKCIDYKNQWNKERRQKLKMLGICPRCGKNRIYENEKSCLECKKKIWEYDEKNREARLERNRTYCKKKYQQLKNDGICVSCYTRKNDGETIWCSICREKNRLKDAARRSQKGRNSWKYDKCYFCGNDRVEGSKCCEKHLKIYRDNASSLDNSFWKNTNKNLFI